MSLHLPNDTLLAGAVLLGIGALSIGGMRFSPIDGHDLIDGAIPIAAGAVVRK
ncbi:MAG: hypothetical protein HRU46_06200 [Verrucomicrobiales bacterium]|nr:hypothetical protein [Verrucomicrobiales bacterium]